MDGYYGLPAGKVEYGENYTQAAVREAKEEAGVDIDIKDLKFAHIVHRHGEENGLCMDWVDVYFEAERWTGQPSNAEEHKSDGLEWIDLKSDTQKIVPSQKKALEDYFAGKGYGEFGW